MSLNNIADLYPNTLSGLSSFNANQILINGVDISTIYVSFINSPLDVDLADKNFTTSGRVQTAVLKLPSATYSTSKVLRVNASKEVESVDLATTYVPYTGATATINAGVHAIQSSYTPLGVYDLVNKNYVDTGFPTFTFVASNYLTQSDASLTYLTQSDASFIYLTQSNASLTYQTQAGMPSFNFTGTPTITSAPAANDDSDKIPTTHWVNYAMSLIYLPITTAASTYLTITNASSTYATITNLNLKANSASPTFTGTVTLPSTVNFTTNPSAGVGTLLAINGSGNLITTTSSVNQTETPTSGTYYLTFVASSATGAFTPLVFSQIMCNPNIGLIEVNNMKITSRNQGGSQVSLLGRDSAGNVIDGFMSQTASTSNTDFPVGFIQFAGTGLFTPLSETSGAFTFNPSTLNLKTSKLQITSVPTGTQQYLLAVNSSGNVIQGTAPALQQTQTLVNANYYIPFVSSFVNGDFLPLIENRVKLNPATGTISMFNLVLTGNANLASLTFNTFPTTGTVAYYLAIDSGGVVIRTTASTSAPTDITPTPINTSTTLYPVFLTSNAGGASTTYVESDGSLTYNPSLNQFNALATTNDIVTGNILYASYLYSQYTGIPLLYDTRSAFPHTFRVNGLEKFHIYGNTVYVNIDAVAINPSLGGYPFSVGTGGSTANNSGKILIKGQSTTDGYGPSLDFVAFNTNNTPNAKIECIDNGAYGGILNFWIKNSASGASGTADKLMALNQQGLWFPSDGSTSIYIRDTLTTATTCYGRLFGLGTTVSIYQDFYNRFQWRTTDLSGLVISDIMYLRNSGLNVNQSSTTHPTLDNYELVVGNNASTVNSSAKILIRGATTTTGFGPSIDFTSWYTHTTPQASIEVIDNNNWGGIFKLRAKADGAGSAGALSPVLSADPSGFFFAADRQGSGTNFSNVYACNNFAGSSNFKVCQRELFYYTYTGNWVSGVFLGSFDKLDTGSKLKVIASTTQYSGSIGTFIAQLTLVQAGSGTVYNYPQNTFTNIINAHWVCPIITVIFNLPAGNYSVYVNGNGLSDINDYVRLTIEICPS